MYVIKATSSDDECFHGRNLFLVRDEDMADKIVGEFNSAAQRYEGYLTELNNFREQYEDEYPYPVYKQDESLEEHFAKRDKWLQSRSKMEPKFPTNFSCSAYLKSIMDRLDSFSFCYEKLDVLY